MEDLPDHSQLMDNRMVGWAKRNHSLEGRDTRRTMMDDDRAFLSTGPTANLAPATVTSKHPFSMTAEVGKVPSLQRVTGRAHSARNNIGPSAGT